MIVRLVMPWDEAAILDLTRMDVAETLPHHTFDPGITRETFNRSVNSGDPTIFVVEQHGDVIGFLMAHINGYAFTKGVWTTPEVTYVRPDKRGTRAAALLIDEFLKWSDLVGAKEIITGNSNGLYSERTKKLWQRFGFEFAGYSLKKVRHGVRGR